jgi:chaperonin GroES
MSSQIKPIGDRVLLKQLEAMNETKSGIILPDSAKEKPLEAKVIAVGNGKVADDGKLIPVEVAVGDVVIYSKYSGTEIKIEQDDYVIVNSTDILAIKKI